MSTRRSWNTNTPINVNDPIWIEIVDYIKNNYHMIIFSHDWYYFVIYFTRDHLIKFLDICPNVLEVQADVVHGIIQIKKSLHKTEQDLLKRLDELTELWAYDYSKDNYISMCLRKDVHSIPILKYFMDRGSTFEEDHAKYAFHVKEDVLNFMMENGMDADKLASATIKYITFAHRSISDRLKFFARQNLDMTGHLLEDHGNFSDLYEDQIQTKSKNYPILIESESDSEDDFVDVVDELGQQITTNVTINGETFQVGVATYKGS
jgi:hypothetical protein